MNTTQALNRLASKPSSLAIPTAMEQVWKSIEEHAEIFGQLEARLQPILDLRIEHDSETNKLGELPPPANLAEELDRFITAIKKQSDLCRDVISRLLL